MYYVAMVLPVSDVITDAVRSLDSAPSPLCTAKMMCFSTCSSLPASLRFPPSFRRPACSVTTLTLVQHGSYSMESRPSAAVNCDTRPVTKSGVIRSSEYGVECETRTRDSLPFRIFVSTGDLMGDIHGSFLVKELLTQAEKSQKTIEVYALGGQRMKEAGATLIGDNTGLSSIGLLEALPFVVPSLLLQMTVRKFLEGHPPHVLVLLDYPGVNIAFGQYVKKKFGCRIVYYIPPNEWLWTTFRTAKIVSMSDTILANYPGEAEYYTKAGGNVMLVGHPLLDTVKMLDRQEARQKLGVRANDRVVALLPASRQQELRHVWPTIASAAGKILTALTLERGSPLGVHFIIPAVLPDQRHIIEKGCEENAFQGNSLIWNGDPHVVFAASDVAITKSGSANLELALYNVPQVVVYKIDAVTAWLARKVFQLSLKHVSLVNLILDSKVIPEFIQEGADADMVVQATMELLSNTHKRTEVLKGYERLRTLLGEPGVVSRAAHKILSSL